VHGVDANDKVVFNKPLRRSQVLPFFAKLAPCLIGMQGYDGLKMLLAVIADSSDARLPENARASLSALVAQIASCQAEISAIEKRLLAQHRKNGDSKRLETIPGIGVLGASAIVATVPDASIFKTGRDFAAWIGIVSREDSTGGKQRLGPISKQGDRYLRRILVVGAFAVIKQARAHPEKYPWLTQLLARKPAKVAAVALANKIARIAWAVLTKKDIYRVRPITATPASLGG
jgi:transposase